MGLLDDAIREHLELKRRHGADPGEVARQEQEAFGPVRRAQPLEVPAEPLAPPGDHEPAVDDPHDHAPYEEVHETPYDEPAAGVHPVHEPAYEDDLGPGDEPADDPGQNTVAFSLEDLEREEHRQPPPPTERPRAAPPPPSTQETGEGDELAETPEFLQETPEHDRLWFEQKPPRDFDF